MTNEQQRIMSELGDVKATVGRVEGLVETLATTVNTINNRSISALERLATYEERFATTQTRITTLETAEGTSSKLSEKFLTLRDLRVGSIVLGTLWALVKSGVWIAQQVKNFI